MRSFTWPCLALCLTLAVPATAESAALETGSDFLARRPASRIDYVAGLSDQLLQLHAAGLVRGFHWYERCLRLRGTDGLTTALTDYIAAEPSREPEPVARNFIWAAAEICTYP